MDNREQTNDATDSQLPAKPEPPRSLAIAEKGIKTGRDFAAMMSALMSDLIDGRVSPGVGNAACNAGGKLLKVVEMQQKYGTQGKGQQKQLSLVEDTDASA